MRIALLEDDIATAELMALWLESADHAVSHYENGESFKKALMKEHFDLLILDWLLPDTTGDQVLTWIRESMGWQVPVVFITQKDSQNDIVAALNSGADDFMTKPVSEPVLKARISAVGRRYLKDEMPSTTLDKPPFRFDLSDHVVTCFGEKLPLTQKEFDLAAFIFRNEGHLVTRSHIQEAVWGHSGSVTTRTIDIHISRIRKKLGLDKTPWRLSAVYHHGYRLERPTES